MRYLREWINAHGKEAAAYEDEVTDVDVSERLVTLTSHQGRLTVRAQFTRQEFERIFEAIRHEREWSRRLELPAPKEAGILARVARAFSFRI